MVERGSTTFTSPPASSKAAPAKLAPVSSLKIPCDAYYEQPLAFSVRPVAT